MNRTAIDSTMCWLSRTILRRQLKAGRCFVSAEFKTFAAALPKSPRSVSDDGRPSGTAGPVMPQ